MSGDTDGSTDKKVHLVELEGFAAPAIRHVGPYTEVGAAFQQLAAWAKQAEVWSMRRGILGIPYDDPERVPADRLRYDAALRVDMVPEELSAPVRRIEVAGGKYAVYRHEGDYSGLGDAYRFLRREWLPSSGYEADDRPCLEEYLNDPEITEPDKLLTDVYLPIR